MDDEERLSHLISRLDQEGWDTDGLTYPGIREKAQAAAFPAHQGPDYIWRFYGRNTSTIAVKLKLKRRAAAPSDPSARRQCVAA
jgi:hypothetical protein